jgi:hypothetical protein
MYDENEIDKAVDYLRSSAQASGQARGRMAYQDGNLRRVKSLVMLEKQGSLGDREAQAYASDQYKEALEQLENATADYETIRAKREAAIYAIEVWRSMNASKRQGI